MLTYNHGMNGKKDFLIISGIFLSFFIVLHAYATTQPSSVGISTPTIAQGETLVIITERPVSVSTTVQAWVGSRRVWMFPHNEKYIGFYSAPAKAIPRTYNATIIINDDSPVKIPVKIKDAKFPVTKLVVTQTLKNDGFTPSTIGSNLAESDTPAIIAALSNPANDPYFSKSFGYPLSVVKNVGAFGNYRSSGKTKLQHLGVDLDATTGTPVYAINDGVVTMTKRLINYGNSIVIDHGAHIFSMSLHLDSFAVKTGEKVTKGQIIGYSGNTGYSIAPHLHLSINVNGTSIDPLKFIETTQRVMH